MNDELFRPGLEGIIAGETAISAIADGLRYRGYSIEDLASESTFEEVAYLLLNGELPNQTQAEHFQSLLDDAAGSTPSEVIESLRSPPPGAPMMDIMRSGASLLGHWDPDEGDDSREASVRKAIRLLGRLPRVMAARMRQLNGESPLEPRAGKSLAWNTLWMLRGKEPSERSVRALDMTLILYAEHEFNASAFTARVICSTRSDLYSAVVGAIGALKGPLHGGANERVMEVLEEVGGPEQAEAWVRDALARKVRIMGFGHRVYKTGDPRAAYLKPLCEALAKETGNEGFEQTAATIEKVVREEKGLPPNLDWPSARLYYYLGLPVPLYTPLFVLSRVAGWSAHVIEQAGDNRLIRPRSRYTGPAARDWVAIGDRD